MRVEFLLCQHITTVLAREGDHSWTWIGLVAAQPGLPPRMRLGYFVFLRDPTRRVGEGIGRKNYKRKGAVEIYGFVML